MYNKFAYLKIIKNKYIFLFFKFLSVLTNLFHDCEKRSILCPAAADSLATVPVAAVSIMGE